MVHIVYGCIGLAMAAYAWFGIAQNANEESATGFVLIWKKIFGIKGYVITAKILAVMCLLAACSEFYQYFTNS